MKHLLLALVASVMVFASEYTITAINGDKASIEGGDLVVGKSGFVVRTTTQDSFIIGSCVATANHEISIKTYDNLKQEAMPTLLDKPKVGDTVVFGLYDSRKLPIVKNHKQYLELSNNETLAYLHPDLFAMLLHDKGEIKPTKERFKEFCNQYSVGIVAFAIDDTLYDVDCMSFVVLNKSPIAKNDIESKLPFFNRFEKINKGLLNFESDMGEFETYYKALLGIQ